MASTGIISAALSTPMLRKTFPGRSADGGFEKRRANSFEPIVLAAGEGVAIIQTDYLEGHVECAEILVRDASSGATYTFSTEIAVTPAALNQGAWISLLNGAGSGVTLEVWSITLFLAGDSLATSGNYGPVDDARASYRMVLCDGMRGGTIVSGAVSAHRSDSSLPAEVRIVQGPFRTLLAGESKGLPVDWQEIGPAGGGAGPGMNMPTWQKIGAFRRVTYPGLPGSQGDPACVTPAVGQKSFVSWTIGKDTSMEPIKIRQGEGIALSQGVLGVYPDMSWKAFEISAVISYEEASVSAAAPGVRAGFNRGFN